VRDAAAPRGERKKDQIARADAVDRGHKAAAMPGPMPTAASKCCITRISPSTRRRCRAWGVSRPRFEDLRTFFFALGRDARFNLQRVLHDFNRSRSPTA
jgi:hypothetical protein